MPYNYAEQRERLFSIEGYNLVLDMWRQICISFKAAGAMTSGAIVVNADGWDKLAAIDMLAELGYLYKRPGHGDTTVLLPGPNYHK